MRMLAFGLAIAMSMSTTGVGAHHKPGHHTPPGHLKKQHVVPAPANPEPLPQVTVELHAEFEAVRWREYTDPEFGFRVALPSQGFDLENVPGRGIALVDAEGAGEILVYGAENPRGLSARAFVEALEGADRIREVTYRAEGRSWFVLSGFYQDQDDWDDEVIFYAKYMFSADRSALSAIEITFRASEKPRFAPLVEQIEDSLTAPL